jgi:DegV family protein with EDD domain
MSFLYSGSFRCEIEKDQYHQTRIAIGIQDEMFEYPLKPGEIFDAPEVAFAYADDGLTSLSQKYHKLIRNHVCRGIYKNAPRPVLINNWEATYFDFDGNIYVVTLSSQLSGSYNSAELAKKLYLEEHPDKKIEIIDSRSASVGQTLITMKIKELEEAGQPYDAIVKTVNKYRDGMLTKFVLESLDTLRKNGRLSGLQAIIASALNIKPVMGSTPEGTIYKIDQARGIIKALLQMVKSIERDVIKPQERTLGIAHCNNRERAEFVKDEILKRIPFKDYFIVDTAGVSSMYANEGGIITAY